MGMSQSLLIPGRKSLRILSCSPATLDQGETDDITVTCVGARTGDTASFSGTGLTVNSTTRVSSRELTVNVTADADATISTRSLTITRGSLSRALADCLTVVRTQIKWADFLDTDKAHLEAAHNAALDLGTGDFVLSVNTKRAGTGNQTVVAKYQDADNYWKLEITATTHLAHFIAVASGATVIDIYGKTALDSTTTKYHIVVCVDRDSGLASGVWVNGVEDTAGKTEMVTNGDLSSAAGWSTAAEVSITGGEAVFTASTSNGLYQDIGAQVGHTYCVQFEITSCATGEFRLAFGGASGYSPYYTTTGLKTWEFTPGAGANGYLVFITDRAVTGKVTSVSCREVPLVAATDISNTGKLYVGQNGAGALYWNGHVAQLGIHKPASAYDLYLMGDSLTLNLSSETKIETALGDGWTVHNKGVAGETTTQMAARFATDITNPGDAEYVTIWGGFNDLLLGSPTAEQIETNLQTMYSAAKAAGLRVIAITMTPTTLLSAEKLVILAAVNTWILATAEDVDYRLDLYSEMEDPENPGELLPAYDWDGVHFTQDGITAAVAFIHDSVSWAGFVQPTSLVASLYNAGHGKLHAELTAEEIAEFGVAAYWDMPETSGARADAVGANDLAVAVAELVTNGGFADGTGWTSDFDGAGAGVSGGAFHAITSGDSDPTLCNAYQDIGTIAKDRSYTLQYGATKASGTTVGVKVAATSSVLADAVAFNAFLTDGGATVNATPTGDGHYLQFYGWNNAANDWDVDNVSLKAGGVPGATSA